MIRKLILLPFIILPLITTAQTPSAFVGSWKVTWEGDKRQHEARLVLAESGGGSWKTFAQKKGNPCMGREVPVSIEGLSQDTIVLKLKFSEAIAGCTDSSVTLKRLNDKAISGSREDVALTIVRE